jgi:hypothetical protein
MSKKKDYTELIKNEFIEKPDSAHFLCTTIPGINLTFLFYWIWDGKKISRNDLDSLIDIFQKYGKNNSKLERILKKFIAKNNVGKSPATQMFAAKESLALVERARMSLARSKTNNTSDDESSFNEPIVSSKSIISKIKSPVVERQYHTQPPVSKPAPKSIIKNITTTSSNKPAKDVIINKIPEIRRRLGHPPNSNSNNSSNSNNNSNNNLFRPE